VTNSWVGDPPSRSASLQRFNIYHFGSIAFFISVHFAAQPTSAVFPGCLGILCVSRIESHASKPDANVSMPLRESPKLIPANFRSFRQKRTDRVAQISPRPINTERANSPARTSSTRCASSEQLGRGLNRAASGDGCISGVRSEPFRHCGSVAASLHKTIALSRSLLYRVFCCAVFETDRRCRL
jgi:hypothetical protein